MALCYIAKQRLRPVSRLPQKLSGQVMMAMPSCSRRQVNVDRAAITLLFDDLSKVSARFDVRHHQNLKILSQPDFHGKIC